MVPEDRLPRLDVEKFKSLGMSRERMVRRDALFFFQLILPIHRIDKTDIVDDGRKDFFAAAASFSNLYAVTKLEWGDYDNTFKPTSARELVNWIGALTRNKNEDFYSNWDESRSGCFDETIYNTFSARRCMDVKRMFKLSDVTKEIPIGSEGFDPTQKYRLVWDATCHNVRNLLLSAGKDLTIDETSWPSANYSAMHKRLKEKPGISKGGQHAIVCDANKRFIYDYTPRHSFFKRPPGFGHEGPAEVHRLLTQMKPMIGEGKFYDERLHFTLDNHFSGDNVVEFIGAQGHGATMTTRRNRLCQDVPNKYFHYQKVPVDARSKAARFEQPIVAVKTVWQPEESEKKDYRVVICSFQSTGGTNITTVNALNKCGLYAEERERGRGDSKRKWAIEMNEARRLYLTTYCAVDKIDQMLRAWKLKIRTWKWWHHPALHGVAMAMSMAYEFYKMCADGDGDPTWKMEKQMTGPQFREKLELQMLEYNPIHLCYPGDAKLRTVTRLKKQRRGKSTKGDNEVCEDGELRVGFDDYMNAINPRGRGGVSRFGLATSDILKKHLNSMRQVNGARCEVCGRKTFWRCDLCNGARMCLKSDTNATSMSCVLDYHSEDHYGLVKGDKVSMFGMKPTKFNGVKPTELKKNRVHMNRLRKRMYAGEDIE
jgi:hypothetical protein